MTITYKRFKNTYGQVTEAVNKYEDGVALLKQFYHCDTMFRAKGHLWLCNKVIDIDYEETQT